MPHTRSVWSRATAWNGQLRSPARLCRRRARTPDASAWRPDRSPGRWSCRGVFGCGGVDRRAPGSVAGSGATDGGTAISGRVRPSVPWSRRPGRTCRRR
jgi:hypothetical protein